VDPEDITGTTMGMGAGDQAVHPVMGQEVVRTEIAPEKEKEGTTEEVTTTEEGTTGGMSTEEEIIMGAGAGTTAEVEVLMAQETIAEVLGVEVLVVEVMEQDPQTATAPPEEED
jgi:hypothetical protein